MNAFWVLMNALAAILNWWLYAAHGHQLINLICAVVSTAITLILVYRVE